MLKKARLQKPYVMQLSEALGYEKSYLTVEELLKDRMSLCAAIKTLKKITITKLLPKAGVFVFGHRKTANKQNVTHCKRNP